MRFLTELVVTELGDEYVAVPMMTEDNASRCVIRMNDSGAMILNCLIEGKDRETIVEKILSEYEGVTREMAEESIQSVVDKLQSAGLIEE